MAFLNHNDVNLIRAQRATKKVAIPALGKSVLAGPIPAAAHAELKRRDSESASGLHETKVLEVLLSKACSTGSGEPLDLNDARNIASLLTLDEVRDLIKAIEGAHVETATPPAIAPVAPAA